MNPSTGLLSPTKAAHLLGVHRRTLDRWVKKGHLKRDFPSGMFWHGELKVLQEARYQEVRERLIEQLMDKYYCTTETLPF